MPGGMHCRTGSSPSVTLLCTSANLSLDIPDINLQHCLMTPAADASAAQDRVQISGAPNWVVVLLSTRYLIMSRTKQGISI